MAKMSTFPRSTVSSITRFTFDLNFTSTLTVFTSLSHVYLCGLTLFYIFVKFKWVYHWKTEKH